MRAQLSKKSLTEMERFYDFSKIRRFTYFQSEKLQEAWNKNSSENKKDVYYQKNKGNSKRKFQIINETLKKEFAKIPFVKVMRPLKLKFSWRQMMEKFYDWIF